MPATARPCLSERLSSPKNGKPCSSWRLSLPGTRLTLAAQRPGVNLNALLDDQQRDPLSGTSVLGGVGIRMAALGVYEPAT